MPLPTVALPTHDELIDYLKTKDPKGEYVWQDPVFCLMGNFYRDHNIDGWSRVIYSDMPDYGIIAGEKPWTFGAALDRAQALRAEKPKLTSGARELAQLQGERLALTSGVEVLK